MKKPGGHLPFPPFQTGRRERADRCFEYTINQLPNHKWIWEVVVTRYPNVNTRGTIQYTYGGQEYSFAECVFKVNQIMPH